VKRFIIFVAVFSVLGLLFSTLVLAEEDPTQHYAKYLSVADVEKVTVLKGITGQHKYTLYFFNAEGQEILRVQFYRAKGGGADKILDLE
jgi:hypothetical protein